jgi:hypothetical protein
MFEKESTDKHSTTPCMYTLLSSIDVFHGEKLTRNLRKIIRSKRHEKSGCACNLVLRQWFITACNFNLPPESYL